MKPANAGGNQVRRQTQRTRGGLHPSYGFLDSYRSDLSQVIAASAKGQSDAAAVLQTAQTLRTEMKAGRLFA